MTETTTPTRPKVLIIGAGVGGLTLGTLLERAGVPYEIYERAATAKALGSAMSLTASVMAVFKQLGLYDELHAKGNTLYGSRTFNERQELLSPIDYRTGVIEHCAFPNLIIARPILYDLLLAQIPSGKIHYHKKLVSYEETSDGVTVHFADKTFVSGGVLVGGDGANSVVRKNMYEKVEAQKGQGAVPASDKEALKYSSISLVGQTKVLDPEKYPFLRDPFCRYDVVISDSRNYTVAAFPTKQNTVCWMAIELLSKPTTKDCTENTEWGPEACEAMAADEDFRKIRIPGANGATMGEFIDASDKNLISKVMLEEKLFQTWTHGRAVLMGDACHKMTPSAGLGAVTAVHDAIVLANYLESLKDASQMDITTAFEGYKAERVTYAKAAVDASNTTFYLLRKGFFGWLLRKIMSNPPYWLWHMFAVQTGAYRPQVAFLPRAEDKGSIRPLHQPSLFLEKSTVPV